MTMTDGKRTPNDGTQNDMEKVLNDTTFIL
jgi:hypothetical protein